MSSLASIHILQVLIGDEYQEIRQTIIPNLTLSFRYRVA
jgi:hypothetical protein